MEESKEKYNESEAYKSHFVTKANTRAIKDAMPSEHAIDKALRKEALEKAPENYPLISCIMPTANRYKFVFESINSFLRQDYPNKELIIVFDQPSDLPAIQFPANVKLIQTKNIILGAKRNEACSYASGTIIAHWDDDDIYNTNRLSVQAKPIIEGKADITGLQNFVYLELPAGKGWMPKESLHSEVYVCNVHGGTLVYNRWVWEQIGIFPHYKMGEDTAFLRKAVVRRVRLMPLPGYFSIVYVRHTSNTSRLKENNFTLSPDWTPAIVPEWAQEQTVRHMNMTMNQPIMAPFVNANKQMRI